MNKITTGGLDLAKAVFQFHGVDDDGRVVVRKQIRRAQLLEYFAQLPACLIGMEACGGAHYWARKLRALGHEVRLIPPQYVRPYVKSNKHDVADAEAICEAVRRPNMRFVPVKTSEQQAILSVHRAREGLVRARTATVNHIRGLLAEFGIVLPQGIANLRKAREQMEACEDLPGMFRRLIEGQLDYLRQIEDRAIELERQIQLWYRQDEASKRLAAIPGIGVITATAVVASVGDARFFESGRHLATWLGLVPKQSSTGGKVRLLGISKRGDGYLRRLLIHGARAVLRVAESKPGAERAWHVKVKRRRNTNIAAVALAHKNARTIWALLAKNQEYDPLHRAVA